MMMHSADWLVEFNCVFYCRSNDAIFSMSFRNFENELISVLASSIL